VGGQAGQVGQPLLREVHGRDGVLEPLADDVELALEVGLVTEPRAPADEDLLDVRLGADRAGPQGVVVGGHVPPAQRPLAFLVHERVEEGLDLFALDEVARQEDETGPVLPGRGQDDPQPGALAAQERVGHLEQDARAVARVRLAAAGAPVQEVLEHGERLDDDVVGLPPLHVHDEADAAGVVLLPRVVESLGGRGSKPGLAHAAVLSEVGRYS
jgi:hypothetical protein